MAKIKKIYEALVEGARDGQADKALFQYVLDRCPKATSKKIVKASLLALSDPDVREENVLHAIYALAIKHRLDPATGDDADDGDDEAEAVFQAKPDSKKSKGKGKKHKDDEAKDEEAKDETEAAPAEPMSLED